jgi:uncharacterized protein
MSGDGMARGSLRLRVPPELRFLLAPRHRDEEVAVALDGTSSLGHLVEALGIPLPEVGALLLGGQPVASGHRPTDGDVVTVQPVGRPQRLPDGCRGWLLDVHLGTLARRMRLLGLDTSYRNDAADDVLVERASAERRLLLTRDRGLLRRRALWAGAFVRGDRPDDQLADVLDRFRPVLRPWSRCPACNGPLDTVEKAEVEHLLPPGTRRSYDTFVRCVRCGHLYWHGAHGARLAGLVRRGLRLAESAAAGPGTDPGSTLDT